VFNAGLAYVLSKEALRRVSVKFKTMPVWQPGDPRDLCHDESGSGDDTSIAVCLREIGILADNTLDAQGRQRFFPFQLHAHYTHKRDDEESWFWKYKPRDVGVETNCCVPEVIAAHGYGNDARDDEEFYKLHEMALRTRNITHDIHASIPPKPSWFLYDKEALDFEVDEWRNSLVAPSYRTKWRGYKVDNETLGGNTRVPVEKSS
jgi:hypothetical protein